VIPKGVWHQLGHNNQNMALEQLQQSNGVGVIISARDLKLALAEAKSQDYRALGAKVLLDQQFHIPDFKNTNLKSYGTFEFRQSVTSLNQVDGAKLDALSAALESENRRVAAAAVIAPAVVYEANRPELIDLNIKLFEAGKKAGDALGVPTLATVVLGNSVVVSPQSISSVLAHITGLPCGGWYYTFEFSGNDRVPMDRGEVLRCGSACLTLATNANGRPVIHAYSGPMTLLSFGFGATGAGLCYSQTMWQFDRSRYAESKSQGGPGKIPPRFFSTPLWGTMICPEELMLLPESYREGVMHHSPFSQTLASAGRLDEVDWGRWDSYKHLVYCIGAKGAEMASQPTARAAAAAAIDHLTASISFHTQIAQIPVPLKDESVCSYQQSWKRALHDLLTTRADDYDALELFG
jgi:hypothetical protein